MVKDNTNPDYNPDNIFAQILRSEIPSRGVYESSDTYAFWDAAPAAPVHVLVIPRGAYIDFHDFTTRASKDEIIDFWRSVDSVVQELGLLPDGFRLVTNTGRNSGQIVPHFHVHILGGAPLGPLLSDSDA